jgi:hypothetical protein
MEKGKSEHLSIWSQKKQDPKTEKKFVGFWIQIGIKKSPMLHLRSSSYETTQTAISLKPANLPPPSKWKIVQWRVKEKRNAET